MMKKKKKHNLSQVPPPPPQSPPPSPPSLDTISNDEQWIHQRQNVDLIPIPVLESGPSLPSASSECAPVFNSIVMANQDPVPEEGPQKPWNSPYTEYPVRLHFGIQEIVYLVPPHFLPLTWIRHDTDAALHFPDVDIQTGHTIVHYLYKETYETPFIEERPLKNQAGIRFRAALAVFVASSNHDLDGLQHLAIREMEVHGAKLGLSELLKVIDDSFSLVQPASWVHRYLRRTTKIAFLFDHTVFTNDDLLQDLRDADLIKFIARCITDIYSEELSRMIGKGVKTIQEEDVQDSISERFTKPVYFEVQAAADEQPPNEALLAQIPEPEVETAHPDERGTVHSLDSSSRYDNAALGSESCSYIDPIKESRNASLQQPEDPRPESCEPTAAWLDTEPEPEKVSEGWPQALDHTHEPSSPIACEAVEDAIGKEAEAVPVESDVSDIEASPVCEPADNEQAVEDRPCRLQAEHVLLGTGWKQCTRCRAVVEKLAMQVS